MNKPKIYLDTSVISHLDASDAPEKMADTLRLWEMLERGRYDVVLSDVVLDELRKCVEPKRSYLLASMKKLRYEIIAIDASAVALASKFIDFGVLKEKSFDDCRHIAAALISGCDIIVSWNFKHIVNARTIQGTRKIATAGKYREILICSPTMLIQEDYGGD